MAESINQSELARVAALGAGKKSGGEDEGGDNGLMSIITDGLNRISTMLQRAGVPGMTPISSSLTTGVQAGLESPEGFSGKKIMPGINLSGGDGFFQKLFAALKRGGMSIQDLTAGIMPQEAVDVSWARLGEMEPPSTPVSEVGRGSGISFDM